MACTTRPLRAAASACVAAHPPARQPLASVQQRHRKVLGRRVEEGGLLGLAKGAGALRRRPAQVVHQVGDAHGGIAGPIARTLQRLQQVVAAPTTVGSRWSKGAPPCTPTSTFGWRNRDTARGQVRPYKHLWGAQPRHSPAAARAHRRAPTPASSSQPWPEK